MTERDARSGRLDGVDIPPRERNRLFETGHTTTDDDTGFWLAIVTETADAHGWDVTMTESEAGGARFEFSGVAFAEKEGATARIGSVDTDANSSTSGLRRTPVVSPVGGYAPIPPPRSHRRDQ